MDKDILKQYIDACEAVKETEEQIRRLQKNRKTVVVDAVKGSMHDFPFAAKSFKVAGIVHSVGLESVLSPKFITASHMLRLVRGLTNSQGSVMNALYRIADGGAEAMEFTVSPNTRNLGVALKDLRLKPNILIAVLVRDQEIIIPEGSTFLQAGDRVIVISKDSGIRDLNDIYRDEVPVGGAQ